MKRKINKPAYGSNFLIILRKYLKNFPNLLYKPALLIVILQILFFSFIYIDKRNAINSKIENSLRQLGGSFDTLYPEDYINYGKDLFLSFLPSRKIEKVDLQIGFEELIRLDCDRKRFDNCLKNGWAKGKMAIKNKIYPIKLKSKGDREIHRKDLKRMSFKIDIRGDDRYEGMEEFSIQMPVIRNYTYELFASKVLSKENIVSPRHRYIRLFLNGEYLGIRHLEEGLGRELIESSSRRYGPIFSLKEDIAVTLEETQFDLTDSKYWMNNNPLLAREMLTILESTKFDNRELINNYFDINLWARYFALLDLLELFHGTKLKSVRYYLNPSSGLIEPIFYDGHLLNGVFKEFHLTDFYNKNNEIIKCKVICEDRSFFEKFFGTKTYPNQKFYYTYLETLERFSRKENIDYLRKLWNELRIERGILYREFWRKDSVWHMGFLPHVASWKSFQKRLNEVESLIKNMKSYEPLIAVDNEINMISVTNTLSRLPQIIEFKCGINSPKKMILVKDNKVNFNYKSLDSCELDNLNYSLDDGKTYKNIKYSYSVDSSLFNKINNFEEQKASLSKLKENYIFSSGNNDVKEPIEITNKNVIFESGAEICLYNNAFIKISDSIIKIKGEKSKQVKISNCSPNYKLVNNSSIIFENSNIDIKNLTLTNLGAPKLKLRILYGGLNIIRSKVKIDSLEIKNSKSEDAFNVLHSSLKANEIFLNNIKSDALDSDFSDIKINNLSCYKVGNDCIDLSFSNGLVDNINGNIIGDKAISLGESSKLDVNKVNIKNSEIGAVCKDSSILKIKNLDFQNLKLPLAAYIKKPEFSFPTVTIENSDSPSNLNYLISRDSKVKLFGELIESKFSSEEVKEKLYGNIYGAKTIR
tara:strand:+ start:3706 stop:6315 length:2610 start_codon:yes stop_codon:yes gene_type:complete